MRHRRQSGSGFTLVELIVVIGLIVLLASTTLPGIIGIFTSGADSQAFNLIGSQLTATRTQAFLSGTYAGLHVQMIDNTTTLGKKNPDTCWSSIMLYDMTATTFSPALGFQVQKIPGTIAMGEVSTDFRTDTGFAVSDATKDDFLSFTIVFSPAGQLVTRVNANNVRMKIDDPIFTGTTSSTGVASAGALWSLTNADNEPGAVALTVFDYVGFKSATNKSTYLNENAQVLSVNTYTGQIYQRN